MTVTIGWWALPLLITIVSLGWCYLRFEKRSTDKLGAILEPFVASFCYGIAIILSLVAWLVWALLK